MFVVRATFVLADGTNTSGYLTPPVHGDHLLGTVQPVIISPRGQVFFWCGVLNPSADHITESYHRLGKDSASSVLPIRFRSTVELVGGPVAGGRGFPTRRLAKGIGCSYSVVT
jgi:hypothetical protein